MCCFLFGRSRSNILEEERIEREREREEGRGEKGGKINDKPDRESETVSTSLGEQFPPS